MAMPLLGLLILVALARRVEGAIDYTYVNNLSSKSIRGTTSYNFPFSHSNFVNRLVPPNSYQRDEYKAAACQWDPYYPDNLKVKLWVDGASSSSTTTINCDHSVVAYDNIDMIGVDIYQSKYGYINMPAGPVLFTIHP